MTRGEPSGTEALRALAARLDAEADRYQQLVAGQSGRCVFADSMRQSAALARQFASHIVRRGGLPAGSGVTAPDEGALDLAVTAARIARFRTFHGRDPKPFEYDHSEDKAMRNALIAALPHLRTPLNPVEERSR